MSESFNREEKYELIILDAFVKQSTCEWIMNPVTGIVKDAAICLRPEPVHCPSQPLIYTAVLCADEGGG